MFNYNILEEYYNNFIDSFNKIIPDGIYFIDLELLNHFNLLHFHPQSKNENYSFSRNFQVVETSEKITLLNNEFVVWIVPAKIGNASVTYTFVASNRGEKEPHLELAFIATGVYNSSKLVLKLLESFLQEIKETDKILLNYN